MTVPLTGVTDVQMITMKLSGVTDSSNNVLPDTLVSANMLIGDVNGDKTVNSVDVSLTRSQVGMPVTTLTSGMTSGSVAQSTRQTSGKLEEQTVIASPSCAGTGLCPELGGALVKTKEWCDDRGSLKRLTQRFSGGPRGRKR